MRRQQRRSTPLILLTLCLASGASADEIETSKTSEGLTAYLGVLPAAMIQGHDKDHEESTMHDGVPRGAHAYHVMVAIFDAESGERVDDAQVEAEVTPLGLSSVRKPLDIMEIAGVVTYGNYFPLPGDDYYRIVVSITRGQGTKPILLEFRHEHRTR